MSGDTLFGKRPTLLIFRTFNTACNERKDPHESTMVTKPEEGVERQPDPGDHRRISRCIFRSEAVGRGRWCPESERLRQADQTARARTLNPKRLGAEHRI